MVSNRLKGILRDNSEAPEVKRKKSYLLIVQRELSTAYSKPKSDQS